LSDLKRNASGRKKKNYLTCKKRKRKRDTEGSGVRKPYVDLMTGTEEGKKPRGRGNLGLQKSPRWGEIKFQIGEEWIALFDRGEAKEIQVWVGVLFILKGNRKHKLARGDWSSRQTTQEGGTCHPLTRISIWKS